MEKILSRRQIFTLGALGGAALALNGCLPRVSVDWRNGTPTPGVEPTATTPAKAPEAVKPAPVATATTVDRAAAVPTVLPATKTGPAKPGSFNVGGESYWVLKSEGALGQKYETLVTDKKPRDFGLPARPSMFEFPGSVQEFQQGILENEQRQLDIDQFFVAANRGRVHNLVPSRDCWNQQFGWCRQSPDVTFGVGPLTDNMTGTVVFDSPGQHTVKKMDQGVARATLEEGLLLDPRYADDGRYGSVDGKARKQLPGSDVFLRIAKVVPFRTVLFATNPVTGEYLDLPGHVASEGSEMGLVLPVAAKNNEGPFKALGYVLTYDMKAAERDARHEIHISRGPTGADGAKDHNLLDVRNHGVVLNLR